MNALLRMGTASALVLTASLAGAAFAQDAKTTDTTASEPVTETATTKSTTTSTPTTDEMGAPATTTKSKSKSKVTTSATSGSPTNQTTSTSTKSETVSDAGSVAAPMPVPAATAPAVAPVTAAPVPPNPTVGGAAMDSSKTIAQNASAAPNLTTLVKAVTAADLATTLSGPGPFTVFAPTNDAFTRVDQATLATLLKPENKAKLAKVLTYHVVPGTITAADLLAKADATGGTTSLTTVEGSILTVKVTKAAAGASIEVDDVNGNKSYLETPDVRQSNGIVHVVNGVLFPKLN